jgi:hypothetical protein
MRAAITRSPSLLPPVRQQCIPPNPMTHERFPVLSFVPTPTPLFQAKANPFRTPKNQTKIPIVGLCITLRFNAQQRLFVPTSNPY